MEEQKKQQKPYMKWILIVLLIIAAVYVIFGDNINGNQKYEMDMSPFMTPENYKNMLDMF